MIASLSCIIYAAVTEDEPKDFDSTKLSKTQASLIPIFFGLIGAMIMSKRIALPINNYTGFDIGIDSCIVEFFAYTLMLVPTYISGNYTFGWFDTILGTVAGLLIAAGRIAITMAVSEGLEDLAMSLMST